MGAWAAPPRARAGARAGARAARAGGAGAARGAPGRRAGGAGGPRARARRGRGAARAGPGADAAAGWAAGPPPAAVAAGGDAASAAAAAAAAAEESGGAVQTVISVLFTLAIIMLGGITIGVAYLSYKSWSDKRLEEKEVEDAEKERRFAAMRGQGAAESAAPKGPGGKKGKVADSYLGKARGFGKALEEEEARGP